MPPWPHSLAFGVLPGLDAEYSPALSKIAETAQAIDDGTYVTNDGRCAAGSCHSSLVVGAIQADSSYPKMICAPVNTDVPSLGLGELFLDNVTNEITTVPVRPTDLEAQEAVAKLRDGGVNVVVFCGYDTTALALIRAMQNISFNPYTIVSSATTSTKPLMEYIVEALYWTSSLPGAGDFSGLTAAEFTAIFEDWMGLEEKEVRIHARRAAPPPPRTPPPPPPPPPVHAATAATASSAWQVDSFEAISFGGLCVLGTAIERAGTTDQAAVVEQLQQGTFFERSASK